MPPQFKLFRIPALAGTTEEQELNTFLRSVQQLTVHRNFVDAGPHSYTLFTVEYLFSEGQAGGRNQKKGKVDYKEVLPPEDFVLFSRLRQWRKDQAAGEASAVYTIFTNEQLAQIAGKRPASKGALQEIPGIGEAKTAKYSSDVLRLVTEVSRHQAGREKIDDEKSR